MKNIIILLVIIAPAHCFSQVRLSFSTGLGGFNMQEMKKHQSELHAQFPTDIKVIKSFPAFWSYNLSLMVRASNRLNLGAAIGLTSTGGRMDYRDYSGSISCNQVTVGRTLAIQTDVLLNPGGNLPVYFTGKTGAIFGRYDLSINSDVNNIASSEDVKFRSTNFFIEPGIMVTKRIVGVLSANFMAGYNINFVKGKQKLEDNTDLYLQDNSGNEVRLDWSGFRVNVGLSIGLLEDY